MRKVSESELLNMIKEMKRIAVAEDLSLKEIDGLDKVGFAFSTDGRTISWFKDGDGYWMNELDKDWNLLNSYLHPAVAGRKGIRFLEWITKNGR
jgi:hypothetical protein